MGAHRCAAGWRPQETLSVALLLSWECVLRPGFFSPVDSMPPAQWGAKDGLLLLPTYSSSSTSSWP
jgi:hypothetical protein